MRRNVIIAIVQLIAMALGLLGLFFTMLIHLMEPTSLTMESIRLTSAAALVAVNRSW